MDDKEIDRLIAENDDKNKKLDEEHGHKCGPECREGLELKNKEEAIKLFHETIDKQAGLEEGKIIMISKEAGGVRILMSGVSKLEASMVLDNAAKNLMKKIDPMETLKDLLEEMDPDNKQH